MTNCCWRLLFPWCRRFNLPGSLCLLAWLPLILFYYNSKFVSSVVVGIDVGSEYFKVAVASPGRPFEIVLNFESKRKTSSVVSFMNPTREFASNAATHFIKQPSDVLTIIPALLALNSSAVPNPVDSLVGPFYPLDVDMHDESARGGVKIRLKNRNLSLFPEEILANLFQFVSIVTANFRGIAKQAKFDAVVIVPNSFRMRERQAVLDAAAIAGLNVLSLVREAGAAALHHSLDLPANFTGSKLFLDIGAWRSQACVVGFNTTSNRSNKRMISTTVWKCAETNKISGRRMTLLLADFILRKAKEKLKVKEFTSRTLQRILNQAEKTKLILSANKNSEFYIENFYEDRDFGASISRGAFEDLLKPSQMLSALRSLVSSVLKRANMKLSELSGVEVIGGGWRVPRVQEEIENIIKPHELGQHVNADEGAVLGATLIAANSSSTFRIQNTLFSDLSDYEYSIRVRNVTNEKKLSEWKHKSIVKFGGLFGGFRTLTIRTCCDLDVELYEADLDGNSVLLTKYEITGIKENCMSKHKEHGMAKVSFVFILEATGIVALDKVVSQWEERALVPAPATTTTTTTTTNSTSTTTTTKSDGSGEPAKAEGDSDTTTKAAEAATETATGPPKMIEQIRKHTVRCIVVSVESEPRPMTVDGITEAKQRLSAFSKADAQSLKFAKAKNDLESYVYSSKNDMDSELFLLTSTEDLRNNLKAKLTETEDWFESGEIAHASFDDVDKRYRELQELFNPVRERISEMKGREALKELVENLNERIKHALSPEVSETVKFNETSLSELKTVWEEFNLWFAEKTEQQQKRPLSKDPVYRINEVKQKLQNLAVNLESFLKSAKPKKLIKEDQQNATSTDEASTLYSNETVKTESTGAEAGKSQEQMKQEQKVLQEQQKVLQEQQKAAGEVVNDSVGGTEQKSYSEEL